MNNAEHLYKVLLDNHEDFFLAISDSGLVLELNHNVESICMISRLETIGKNFFDICSKNKIYLSFGLDDIKKISEKKSESIDVSIKTDTSTTFLRFKVIKILGDNQTYYVVIGKDITELLSYKKASIKSQMYLQTIIENLPEYVYWKDVNFVYQGCNKLVSEYLNLKSPKDIIGKTDNDFGWSPDRVSFLRESDESIILSGKKNTTEDIIPLNNTPRIMLSTKAPLYDNLGKIMGIIGVSVDITEQKNMEEDLKKAKEAAEMASSYKTQFIANMSHDIRTPLSGVFGYGEELEKKIENPNLRNIAHKMVRSSHALLNMLNAMLDAVSSENMGVEDIREEPFDLPYLVQTIIDLEQCSVDLKKIELLTYIDKKAPPILLGDHEKIYHILLNLVGNAIKFTKEGHIDINIKLLEKNNNAVQVLFEVTDTGIGISRENLGKIFDLFYKVTPSHKGLDKGYGIGLHIVKNYTELLGGAIKVDSEPSKGSKFSFSLSFKIPDKDAIPKNITQISLTESDDKQLIINSAQTIKVADPMVKVEVGLNAPNILIIEDDDDLRNIAENMVSAIHCNSIAATDGETGLELAKSQAFDLVLTDIGLPGMSGIDLAKLLRQYEKDNNKNPVPIVAVTGHGQTVQKECLEAGINHIIIKPMKLQTLTELCTKFALFGEKPQSSLLFDQPDLQHVTQEHGVLGPDLPNTEAELFEINNLPIFDMENAQKILGDNAVLLMKTLKNSINITTPKELPRIKKAHEYNDWIKVADIVHKLKGTYLSLSLTRLGVACQYLERYHQAGHTALLEKLYQQFIKVLEMTVQQLKPWIE